MSNCNMRITGIHSVSELLDADATMTSFVRHTVDKFQSDFVVMQELSFLGTME